MRQREGYQAQLRDQTLYLRKIIVHVKKENLKLKSEKFELGVKYHQVSDRNYFMRARYQQAMPASNSHTLARTRKEKGKAGIRESDVPDF